jgi:ABC-type uncharacterized transport system fused permease/ATPase subunit
LRWCILAEDLRLSVDAPVEFALGVFSVVISPITFIGVLWFIGGALTIPIGSTILHIPGFLVLVAFLYAVLASGAMVLIARGFIVVSEHKNQAEAEYRYMLTRLREHGESIAMLGGEQEECAALDPVSQDRLMRLVMERLPDATIGSVRPRADGMRQPSRWWKRWRRLCHSALLAFAQGYDHRHTACPGRQHIDYGDDFEYKRGQKQGVKTE